MKNSYLRSFSGVIWKLLLDPHYQQLALEVRSEQSLEMFYHVIDLSSFDEKIVYPPKQVDWWSNLLHAYGSRLFVMQYQDQNNPGPGTFLVYDYNHEQVEHSKQRVLIDKIEGPVVRGFFTEDDNQKPFELILDSSDAPYEADYPVLYPEGTGDFQTVADFVELQKKMRISLGVEYLEKRGLIVLSYYKKGNKKYDRYLMLLHNEQVKLDRKIDSDMNGLSTESFFLFGNKLIFVEERITLQVYEY